MMNEVKFADLCDNLQKMNEEQLRQLSEMAMDRIVERRDRFESLCAGLYSYLDAIFEEFPNAKVYLRKSPTELIDLMDYIVPEETYEICEIGD